MYHTILEDGADDANKKTKTNKAGAHSITTSHNLP